MKQQIANYTALIEKQKRTGTNEECYTAYVPALGIATEANTFEEVQKAALSLIQFHVESLVEEGEEVPVETNNSLITKLGVLLPRNAILTS